MEFKYNYIVDNKAYIHIFVGRDKILHTGSYSSYNCKMSLLPEEEVGVWACVNSPGDGRGSTAVSLANMYALDLLLGEYSFDLLRL